MEIRALRAEELEKWFDHCGQVFIGTPREYFVRHYRADPWKDTEGIFVAMDGDTIAATVRVFRRVIWMGGQPVKMGGIGEVSTKEEYRRMGLSGALLQKAIAWMEEQGIVVSVLYASKFGHYGRYGWQRMPEHHRQLKLSAEVQPGNCRPLLIEDLPAMAELERQSVKQNWSMVRDSEAYWTNWFWAEAGQGLLAEKEGNPQAWLLYSLQEDTWRVREFRALPGQEGLFDGLCAAVASLEGREGQFFTAPGWIPTNHEVQGEQTEGYTMVRLILPFEVDGKTVRSTDELIEAAGDCRDSEIDHF